MEEKRQLLIDLIKKIEFEETVDEITEYVKAYIITYDYPRTSS